ncbi:hypothetical protein [Blastomonas sp. AAP25]|uniref:hypothetical protein n=1 Tax=Blastomonas sp. AAP25 TaxID=1523416 RepID=UPI000A96083B|nr:hypothetical protein [Blastomonas sp. AAP25]
MSSFLTAFLRALCHKPEPACRKRRPRDIVHVTGPEQLGKRAKRRARGKRKGAA